MAIVSQSQWGDLLLALPYSYGRVLFAVCAARANGQRRISRPGEYVASVLIYMGTGRGEARQARTVQASSTSKPASV